MPAVKIKKLPSHVASVKLPKGGPPWVGPCGVGPNGGVTQSLLSRYLSCKERFRVLVVEGWKEADSFRPALDFGNLWHACEEDHAANRDWNADGSALWTLVADYRRRFPFKQEDVLHWTSICAELFPRYVEHWASHPDVRKRTPLLQEQEFDVPYRLPSGRIARLRGKWDAVDLIEEKPVGVYLQENKSKGTVDGQKIRRQLTFDNQTMTYLVALDLGDEVDGCFDAGISKILANHHINGVRYNCVRRPAHKSVESMLKKLDEDSKAGRIEEWFARWRVEVSAADVAKFKRETLDPVLENLCDDWEWWASPVALMRGVFEPGDRRHREFPDHFPRHFRMPYTGYNPLAEGGFGDVDEYLATGSTAGLQKVTTLFPELAPKSV